MATSTFAERFLYSRAFQEHSGFGESDTEFATGVAVAPSSVTAYKTQKEPPPSDRVLLIARRCGVDPGWLMFGDDSQAPAPEGFAPWFANRRAKAPVPTIPRRAFRVETGRAAVKRRKGKG